MGPMSEPPSWVRNVESTMTLFEVALPLNLPHACLPATVCVRFWRWGEVACCEWAGARWAGVVVGVRGAARVMAFCS